MPGFESSAPLAVSQIDAKVWETTAPLIFHAKDGTVISVPVGTRTDFASTPAALTWLVARLTGAPAAVLHDHLWGAAAAGQISYRDADRIFREALSALGKIAAPDGEQRDFRVPGPSRWLMWAAVRWASLTRPGGWRGWHRDAPAVVAITIPGLILASPAVVLLPFMVLLAAVNYSTSTPRNRESS